MYIIYLCGELVEAGLRQYKKSNFAQFICDLLFTQVTRA